VDLGTNSDYFTVQHWLFGFITQTECVYCAVRAESLTKTHYVSPWTVRSRTGNYRHQVGFSFSGLTHWQELLSTSPDAMHASREPQGYRHTSPKNVLHSLTAVVVLPNYVMWPDPYIRHSVLYAIIRHESWYVAHSYFTGRHRDCSSHSPTVGTRLGREGRPNAKPVCGRGLWECGFLDNDIRSAAEVPSYFRNLRLMTSVYVRV